MKTARILFPILVMLLPPSAFGQSTDKLASDAQKLFDRLKTLEGTWQGQVTTEPLIPQMAGDLTTVTLRVTSLGNAMLHNMRSPRRPDDPITMFYLQDDRLLLTHYCDAGNRPRMQASVSADGKSVIFEFLDLSGPTHHGHMNRAVFTFVDANQHIEEWTYVLPNGTKVRARFDLRRVEPST